MLNIDEAKYCILMSQCCNFSGNGLMFTISYMVGRFQTHNVKKEKEEGPYGRGGAKSGSHYQNIIYI